MVVYSESVTIRSADEFVRLRSSKHPADYDRVPRNPAAPQPILERMLDEWAEVRSIAAHRLGRGTASWPGDIGER
jgi:hypothetical protein